MTCRVQVNPETKQPQCPACGIQFTFHLRILMAFTPEDEQQGGGISLRCSNCDSLLWVTTDGEVKATAPCDLPEYSL